MQSIDLSQVEKFSDDINKALDSVPGARRQLHQEIAEMAKRDVDSEIAATVNDSSGKIREWQESHVGSGGGYAAVRATDSSSGSNSPGAITNYLENGHRIRPPSGAAKRYRPRIRQPYVDGRHFYQEAQSAAEADALALAEGFADRLAERLEGK